ncbi:HAD family hydrolase [Nocardia sp. NPDC055165]|uniref:HAD family hydrolase n=1 Tax=Nocardia sp. NPDC060220 TaxID=3347076 RepID=UPI00364880EA
MPASPPCERPIGAIVLDLFGTLVDAPTPIELASISTRLGGRLDRRSTVIEDYFRSTWLVRHDGRLAGLSDLAAHLVEAVAAPKSAIEIVVDELYAIARCRVTPHESVLRTLESLRDNGIRLAVLSDADAGVAAAWPASPLAALVDTAVFSCRAGATKPDPRLYARVCTDLEVAPSRALFVGDGGGDELHGALRAGLSALAVRRRGSEDALVYGAVDWFGPVIGAVEVLPEYLGCSI